MNYIELQQLVQFYLHRTDMAIRMDSFFELARERIAKDVRLVRLQDEVELSIVEGVAALPADYIEVKAMAIPAGLPIRFQDVNNFDRFNRANRGGTGGLAYWTIRGGSFRFSPEGGTDADPVVARLTYFKRPAKLTADEDTNVVTEFYPTLYLFAVLAYAHNAIQDLGSEAVANSNYMTELNKLNESEMFGASGSPSMSGI